MKDHIFLSCNCTIWHRNSNQNLEAIKNYILAEHWRMKISHVFIIQRGKAAFQIISPTSVFEWNVPVTKYRYRYPSQYDFET